MDQSPQDTSAMSDTQRSERKSFALRSGDIKPVPAGLCQCGCGLPTNPERDTNRASGTVAGQPRRYRLGHSGRGRQWPGRTRNNGYVAVLDRAAGRHPCGTRKYKGEHVLIVEAAIGKRLPAKAQVHHVDGDRSNNARHNLVACQDNAYHRLLHRRQRALAECGHADWRWCGRCRRWDQPSTMCFDRVGRSEGHRACKARDSHRQYVARRARNAAV